MDLSSVDVRRLQLRPGDIVVVTTNSHLSEHAQDRVTEIAKEQFPDHKVMLLDAAMGLAVVGAGQVRCDNPNGTGLYCAMPPAHPGPHAAVASDDGVQYSCTTWADEA